jgi:hypothetical protein
MMNPYNNMNWMNNANRGQGGFRPPMNNYGNNNNNWNPNNNNRGGGGFYPNPQLQRPWYPNPRYQQQPDFSTTTYTRCGIFEKS